jgi:hypothetical protein
MIAVAVETDEGRGSWSNESPGPELDGSRELVSLISVINLSRRSKRSKNT